jgi:hypothetical protein
VLDGVRIYQSKFGLVSDERDQLERIMRQAPEQDR